MFQGGRNIGRQGGWQEGSFSGQGE